MYTTENEEIYKCEINKSKFISLLYRVDNIKDVEKYLDIVKTNYKGATHYCYAYILGNDLKYCDDGEPSKTAGSPILNILKKNKLDRILCIVVRYFGGIKLGSGGLIRAYSNCCKEVITKATLKKLIKGLRIRFEIDYSDIQKVNYLLQDVKIIYKEFNEKVLYEVLIEESDLDKYKNFNIEIIESCYITN